MAEPGAPSAADFDAAAVAAYLAGDDRSSAASWERAQVEFTAAGDPSAASRCAFWLGLTHLLRGEQGPSGGWMARAERLAEEAPEPCAVRGLVLLPAFLAALWGGSVDRADTLAAEMLDLAGRCGDPDLLAFALLCRGEVLVARGEVGAGMRALDEAMVTVTTDAVSSVAAGIIYCGVIETCVDAFDLRRAAEWTDALDRWCAAQPGLVPFRGQCMVHRAQLLLARGAWTDAGDQCRRAQETLAAAAHPAVGVALYQLGEVHRLRGEFDEAEAAYRLASRNGFEPEPGFALLRLAEGRVDAAVGAVERQLKETRGLRTHRASLVAAVDVLLAAGDVAGARAAVDELTALVDGDAPPLLIAAAAHATGSVLLAEGDADGALLALRRASGAWTEVAMPYESARTRVQIALACRAAGDRDGADMELESARATFAALGAAPDLVRVDSLRSPAVGSAGGLTDREVEVLRVVATGATNREVAEQLHISEHTVARHLQNIYAKLGLSTRTGATAYAHAHDLV